MNAYKLICGLLCWLIALPAWSSYAIYIGKNLTADGSVMIGGSGDEVSSHWLEGVPAATPAEEATITVGVTDAAFMPGEFMEIPQVAETYRYLTMNYSEYEGFPPPLTNGGLNEHNVAGRDVWSPSRPELVAMTPNPQTGPNIATCRALPWNGPARHEKRWKSSASSSMSTAIPPIAATRTCSPTKTRAGYY